MIERRGELLKGSEKIAAIGREVGVFSIDFKEIPTTHFAYRWKF